MSGERTSVRDAFRALETLREGAAATRRSWPPAPPTDHVGIAAGRLTTALARLPQTADGIADFLERHDYRGGMCDSAHCPLANYLTDMVGAAVNVQGDRIGVTGDGWTITVNPPLSVRRFIAVFDSGQFPQLDSGDPYHFGG